MIDRNKCGRVQAAADKAAAYWSDRLWEPFVNMDGIPDELQQQIREIDGQIDSLAEAASAYENGEEDGT